MAGAPSSYNWGTEVSTSGFESMTWRGTLRRPGDFLGRDPRQRPTLVKVTAQGRRGTLHPTGTVEVLATHEKIHVGAQASTDVLLGRRSTCNRSVFPHTNISSYLLSPVLSVSNSH